MDGQDSVPAAALKVALGGFASLLAGLAAQVLTAYLFGAGMEMDAFFTASIIPLYLQLVLLAGLPFVMIPAFVDEEMNHRENDAWALAGTVLVFTTAVLLFVAVLGIVFSHQVITLVAPGFTGRKQVLAQQMLAIMMFSVPLSSMNMITGGIQNARSRFFWPAAASAVGSLGNVIVLAIFYRLLGPVALAWGMLFSTALQAAVTTIPVAKRKWHSLMPLNDPRFLKILALMLPFVLLGLFTNSKIVLERYFASVLPDGQIAYLGYANKIANIFVVLLAASIANAIFPSMAREYARNGAAGLVRQSEYGMRITLALAVPAVILTSFLARPVIQVIYQHGSFTMDTTLQVSIILPLVMVNEVFVRMVVNLITRIFFVMKDTLTVNIIQSLMVLLYVVFAALLIKPLQYIGLPLALLLQSVPLILLLEIFLLRRVKGFDLKSMFKSLASYTLFSALAASIAWLVLKPAAPLPAALQLLAGGALSLTAFLFFLHRGDHETFAALMDMSGINKIIALIQNRQIVKDER